MVEREKLSSDRHKQQYILVLKTRCYWFESNPLAFRQVQQFFILE